MFRSRILVRSSLLVMVSGLLAGVPHAADAGITTVRMFPFNSGSPLRQLQCNLIAIDSMLYGTSTYGGDEGYGCAFKMNTDGSDLSLLHSFGYQDPDGMSPGYGLATDGMSVYGVTFHGGASGRKGTVYKVGTDGGNFAVLHDQSTEVGDMYSSRPPVLAGSTLYGMARLGGDSGSGAIYKINTDGTDFALLHSFAWRSTDGCFPTGEPVVSGSTIFGTTQRGGANDLGTIFKMDIDGENYSVVHSFTGGSDGELPSGRLTVDGSTVYGFAGSSAESACTIFKFNMDGGGYESLAMLPEGLNISYGGLTLVDETLYGTTYQGGDYDRGTVFKINVDGTDFSIIDSFTGDNGSAPQGGLLLVDSKLYGVTSGWGNPVVNNGSVFFVDIAVPEPSAFALLSVSFISLLTCTRLRVKR